MFELPFQGAQDTRRYDFIKDVARIEILLGDGLADDGFAVALTNNPLYWEGGDREGVADAAFRLGEGRTLAGVMACGDTHGARDDARTGGPALARRLIRADVAGLQPPDGGRYGEFRYLVVHIPQEAAR